MIDKTSRELLLRRWLHSSEEDTAGEMVFRPAGYPLPPSRGRLGIELRPDGTAAITAIGRADAPEELVGAWELDEQEPSVRLRIGGEPERKLPLVSVERDRLVVRKS